MLFFSQASSLPFFLPNTSALSVYSQKFLLFPNCSLVEFSALNLLFSSLAPVLSASLVLSAGSSSWADPAPEEWKVGFFFWQRPCQKPSLLLRLCKGKENQLMPQKTKHKNSLRWQSPSRVQRKCFYNHSRHQGKYSHLEKLVFHHIMYTQSHLEISNTHQMQQPPGCGE